MSILGTVLGGVLGSAVTGLFGLGSSMASSAMEYAQTKEGQERQYQYNKKLAKDQYNYQTKLNKTSFGYQRQLNAEANQYSQGLMNLESALTTQQNQWNALNLPALNRQGYEAAGINPMLAVNASSPTQMIGAAPVSGGSAPSGSATGSSVGGALGAKVNLLEGITNAYKTFVLDKDKITAELEKLRADTNNINAKTVTEGYNQKFLEAETSLKAIDTALRHKDLEWYDRTRLTELRSMMINAIANQTQATAAGMNANTARLGLSIDKYKADTDRLHYNLQKGINSATVDYNKRLKGNYFGRRFEDVRRFLTGR